MASKGDTACLKITKPTTYDKTQYLSNTATQNEYTVDQEVALHIQYNIMQHGSPDRQKHAKLRPNTRFPWQGGSRQHWATLQAQRADNGHSSIRGMFLWQPRLLTRKSSQGCFLRCLNSEVRNYQPQRITHLTFGSKTLL